MSDESDHLEDALYLASQQARVFPCSLRWNDAKAKWEKIPLVRENLKVASTDPCQIRNWDAEFRGPRWGVVADNFVLMDLDGDEAYATAVALGLPETPEVRTLRPGGRHRYYRPFPGAWSGTGVRPGIDIRGGGTGFAFLHARWDLSKMGEAPGWFRVRPRATTTIGAEYDWSRGHFHDTMVRFAAHYAAIGWDFDRIRESAERECGEILDRDSILCITTAIRKFAPGSETARSSMHHAPADLFNPKGAPIQVAFVDRLLEEHRFATMKDTGDVLVYTERGIYEPAETFVNAWVESRHREVGKSGSSRFRSEVYKAVAARTYVERSSVNPSGSICLTNVVLNTESFEPRPHSPDVVYTARMEVTYDPDAASPVWDRVLAEWQPDPEVRAFLEEWIGYGLEDGYPYQYSLVNVGGGDNGKGCFLSVLGTLYSGAISAETLTTLNSRFGPANLFGALVNLADELPAGEITDSAKFKAVTGGSLVRAERKGQDPFAFVNRAKMTFAANQLPKVSDRSRAFWRRIILVRWDFVVPADRKDVHLDAKLRAELPGILNRAIAGLKRVRTRGGFAAVKTVAEAAEAWRRSSDSLAFFADQMLERDPKEMIPKSALMVAYRVFCEEREIDAERDSHVGSRLPDLLPGVHPARPRIGDRQVSVWKGVRLREAPRDASTSSTERGEQGEQGGTLRAGTTRLEGWIPPPLAHPAQATQSPEQTR